MKGGVYMTVRYLITDVEFRVETETPKKTKKELREKFGRIITFLPDEKNNNTYKNINS